MSDARMDAGALDRWLTREPDDDERPPLRCATCDLLLPDEPEGMREYVNLDRCDGEPRVIECSYNDGTHEGVLAIIGEAHRHETYTLAYAPPCGSKDGTHDAGVEDAEIPTLFADDWRHAPHWYVPWGIVTLALRACAAGHVNEEVMS